MSCVMKTQLFKFLAMYYSGNVPESSIVISKDFVL
jgi:hypothetical protein